MQEKLIIFIVLMVLSIIIGNISFKSTSSIDRRKKQTDGLLRENRLKKKFEKITQEKVKASKRYKVETICLQAGLKISYGEYVLMGILVGLVVAIVVGTIMNNPLLALMFAVIGYLAPGQVINMLKNIRIGKMEKQIGAFMNMIIQRYEATKDFSRALEITTNEFRGEEPIYSELKTTVLEINTGKPVTDAMDSLARRTGNKFMSRLSDYYKIASSLGTEDVRKHLLVQAYTQFEEDREIKRVLAKEIAGPVREAYVMLAAIPAFALYQLATNPSYIDFMTNTFIGKVGVTGISGVFIACLWFVNAKIGAPLE